MPALNFQKQFAAAVESGEKRQTIRALRKNPIKAGDWLYLYTGQRTKWCRPLIVQRSVEVIRRFIKGRPLKHVVECQSVTPIKIEPAHVWLKDLPVRGNERRWRRLLVHDLQLFAEDDGFVLAEDLIDWFKKTHGLPFEGVLIRW